MCVSMSYFKMKIHIHIDIELSLTLIESSYWHWLKVFFKFVIMEISGYIDFESDSFPYPCYDNLGKKYSVYLEHLLYKIFERCNFILRQVRNFTDRLLTMSRLLALIQFLMLHIKFQKNDLHEWYFIWKTFYWERIFSLICAVDSSDLDVNASEFQLNI